MREEEAIVGDEETPCSSTIPPDHLRCHRNKGQGCRCKSWKFLPSVYCEYHYNLRRKYRETERERKKKLTSMEQHQVIENKRLRKRRRYSDFVFFSSTDDDDEQEDYNFILSKKTRISTKVSESKEMEKYNISELIIYLKSSFRKQEFENVDKILQMREGKMKMEKKEAENRRAQFKQELGILETRCGKLTSEVEEKKKAIFEVNDTLLDMEIKNLDIQHELEKCNRKKNDLIEKVGRLEKELQIAKERERISEERFTKMSWDLRERFRELERKNRDLESSERRDEGGTEVCKKRLDQLETQVLIEPQGSRMEYAQPKGSQSNVSCSKQGKNNESGKWRLEGVIEKEATEHDRGFYAPANSDSISRPLTRARVPEEAKKCENKQTKTQSETGCELNGAHSPNFKEALNCGGRNYASAEVDLDCCFPSGENIVAQLARVRKESESKQMKFQSEATQAMKGATLSQIKIKEEALNCDEKLCTSPILDSICNSARDKNSEESSLSRKKSISPLVSEEGKGSEIRHTRFQSEDSCPLNSAKFSQVKIKEGALNCDERLYTSASGTSSKQSRNSIAENDSAKDTKELGADCDGISAFLWELRRLKANRPNLTLKRF